MTLLRENIINAAYYEALKTEIAIFVVTHRATRFRITDEALNIRITANHMELIDYCNKKKQFHQQQIKELTREKTPVESLNNVVDILSWLSN